MWKAFFLCFPYLILVVLAIREFSSREGSRGRAFWILWMAVCFSKFPAFNLLGGHAFCPDLPAALILTWDWMYSGAMIYCALATLACFVRFRRKRMILSILAWVLSVWGLYNGIAVPSVHRIEIAFSALPPSLDGYRIVQLADLHASHAARRDRTQAVVDIVNALDADLVCLTGDNVDGFFAASGDYARPLADLRARDGVYGCTGNHEYYFGYLEWRENFYDRLANFRMLANECVLPRPGLALGGVPDITEAEHAIASVSYPDVRAAFASATNGEFRVLLQHRPFQARENFSAANVGLQLSGHTHGGIAPVIRTLIGWFNGGFSRGLYREGDSALYVSPGCGQWGGFPMRFFNPSEITLIILRAGRRRE